MKTKVMLAFILGLALLTACAQPTATGAYPPPATVPVATVGIGAYPPPVTLPVPTTSTGAYPGPTSKPTEAVPSPTHPPVDLTPAQMAAIQAVSEKYNISIDQIKLVSTEAVTWPNGCLGVVIPGVMCTEALVDGFRIILDSSGQQFEIRTNQDGTSVIDAAQQLATLGFVVATTDHTIHVVNPNIPLGPTYNPAFNGFLPSGGSILGTAYVLDYTDRAKVVAIDASGTRDLSFIQNPTYGLAIWRGGSGISPMLAWGTQLSTDTPSSSLQISAPDGSQLQTLLTIDSDLTPGSVQLVAEFWSADGQSLYFSKEPTGLGGYILFGGASNLYQINITTKEVTEIIPQAPDNGAQTCLDAISGDYRFVADHCTPNVITVRELQAGTTATIQAPADITDYRLMGSARFSPAGDRVAFALAKSDPANEQGWVAVGSSSGGEAKRVLEGPPGSSYTVIGWLDDQTLLVQLSSSGTPNIGNLIFTVAADGSDQTLVADGSLLTIIDNR